MSREISASMLVLPKYALFFTSNFLIRDRAVPSSIYERICNRTLRAVVRIRGIRTHQPAEEQLPEVAVSFMLAPCSSTTYIIICEASKREELNYDESTNVHSSKHAITISGFFISIFPRKSI